MRWWRCRRSSKYKCNARGLLDNSGFRVTAEHNHPPDMPINENNLNKNFQENFQG